MSETLHAVLWYLNQGWVGVVVGLCGILFAVYQIRRRTHPAPCFQYTSQRFIEGSAGAISGKVEVLFDGTRVERLTLTQIVFWNDGPTPLRSQDIAGGLPVTFSFGLNSSILDIETSSVSRAANNFTAKASEDRRTASILFDFLDKDDGANIRIWHTGTGTPTCTATLIGVPRGVKLLGRLPPQHTFKLRRRRNFLTSTIRSSRFISLVFILTGLFFIIGTTFFGDQLAKPPVSTPGVSENTSRWLLAAIGLLYAAFGASILWLNRRRFPKSLLVED